MLARGCAWKRGTEGLRKSAVAAASALIVTTFMGLTACVVETEPGPPRRLLRDMVPAVVVAPAPTLSASAAPVRIVVTPAPVEAGATEGPPPPPAPPAPPPFPSPR